jgi:hypothetical protein
MFGDVCASAPLCDARVGDIGKGCTPADTPAAREEEGEDEEGEEGGWRTMDAEELDRGCCGDEGSAEGDWGLPFSSRADGSLAALTDASIPCVCACK